MRNLMEYGTPHHSGRVPLLRRRLTLLVLVLLLFSQVVAIASEADDEVSREYQIKAAFIYNFTKFVTWPQGHFKSENEPIIIAVLGSNPFGPELADAVRNREVRGRRFTVKTGISADELLGVDLLFVPSGKESILPMETLQMLHMSGTLTVGESPGFSEKGGIIVFTLRDEKVRFKLDWDSAQATGFQFSAQFIQLALPIADEN